jgi:phage terminase large subunit-like protein
VSSLILAGHDKLVWDEAAGFFRNPARADRVIAFIECLTIPSGVGQGRQFKLRDWQKKFIRDVYEPVTDAETATRLVREAILSMARKNGKTALIAALVLVHLVGPEATQNGEVYSAANDREQAGIVYKFVAQLVAGGLTDYDEVDDDSKHPWMALDASEGGPVTLVASKKRAACHSNGSFYQALSREAGTKHGLNPTFVIYDELAQAIDRELYDVLNTADGAREEFLFATIGTQSRDPSHILSELIDRGLSSDDPSIVCHLYAVPDEIGDQQFCEPCGHRFAPSKKTKDTACPKCGAATVAAIFDERVWGMANPALGDFLLLESVRKKARQAKASPSFEPSFRNLSLNQRVDQLPGLINGADWRACHDPGAVWEDGEEIYLGLDLSAKQDLCALVGVSAWEGSRLDAWFWKPAAWLKDHETRDRVPYERFKNEGHLIAPPGRDVDYDHVVHQIAELDNRFKILGIAYDRWRMDVLIKAFDRNGINAYYGDDEDGEGIRFVPWGQGFKDMAPAVDVIDEEVAARSLTHRGQPLLTWCVSNAVVTMDPAGNRKLDKSKVRMRIDGAVAMAMAVGLKARDMLECEPDLDEFLSAPIGAR